MFNHPTGQLPSDAGQQISAAVPWNPFKHLLDRFVAAGPIWCNSSQCQPGCKRAQTIQVGLLCASVNAARNPARNTCPCLPLVYLLLLGTQPCLTTCSTAQGKGDNVTLAILLLSGHTAEPPTQHSRWATAHNPLVHHVTGVF
jgi:hypothetical protein